MAADTDIVDLSFTLRGGSIGPGYAEHLWPALQARLPWLGDLAELGVHPLAGLAPGVGEHFLSRHARLILRLPRRHCDAAAALSGARLDVGGEVEVAAATIRALVPATVVHARLVALGEEDEARFLAVFREQLSGLGIGGDILCGKRKQSCGQAGFSVMVRDVSPDESLRLQRAGIGVGRRLGCGIFVPHKSTDPVGA